LVGELAFNLRPKIEPAKENKMHIITINVSSGEEAKAITDVLSNAEESGDLDFAFNIQVENNE